MTKLERLKGELDVARELHCVSHTAWTMDTIRSKASATRVIRLSSEYRRAKEAYYAEGGTDYPYTEMKLSKQEQEEMIIEFLND